LETFIVISNRSLVI